MSFLLAVIGILLLAICLSGVALGVYMASDPKNREQGIFFALWWVSGAAGAVGLAARDGVTLLIGALCFLVAGATYLLFAGGGPTRRREEDVAASEKTTRENRRSGHKHRRAAS